MLYGSSSEHRFVKDWRLVLLVTFSAFHAELNGEMVTFSGVFYSIDVEQSALRISLIHHYSKLT